jgi:hypothetical protein
VSRLTPVHRDTSPGRVLRDTRTPRPRRTQLRPYGRPVGDSPAAWPPGARAVPRSARSGSSARSSRAPQRCRRSSRAGSLRSFAVEDPDRLAACGRREPTHREHAGEIQLHSEPQPVVITATPANQPPVSLVEMNERLKLRHRRWLGVAAVRGDLRRAQEVVYGPSPLSLLPGVRGRGRNTARPRALFPGAGRSLARRGPPSQVRPRVREVAAFARCERALSAPAWSYRSPQTEDTMSSQNTTLSGASSGQPRASSRSRPPSLRSS